MVEFPDGNIDDQGFAALLGLVDSGIVLVLDLEFFTITPEGPVPVSSEGFPLLAATAAAIRWSSKR